jgi:hypothetical protein
MVAQFSGADVKAQRENLVHNSVLPARRGMRLRGFGADTAFRYGGVRGCVGEAPP